MMFYPAKIASERLALFQRGAHAQRYPLPCWQGRLGTNHFGSSVLAGAVVVSEEYGTYVRWWPGWSLYSPLLPWACHGLQPGICPSSAFTPAEKACAIRMANPAALGGFLVAGSVAPYGDALDAHIPRPYAIRYRGKVIFARASRGGFWPEHPGPYSGSTIAARASSG